MSNGSGWTADEIPDLTGLRAVVTGANSGLGLQTALELARHGAHVVMAVRSTAAGDEAARRIDGEVEVRELDLASLDSVREFAAKLTADHPAVDLLVNNAGFGLYGQLLDLDLGRQAEMIEVNVTALMRLARAALSQQLTRGRGGVINVGSTAGFQPDPHAAVYGATKAFVRSFSEALAEELRDEPVHVMLLAPGFTETEFQQVAGIGDDALPEQARMTAEPVAATALRDFARDRVVSVPGVMNTLGVLGADLAPSAVTRRVSGLVHQRFVRSP